MIMPILTPMLTATLASLLIGCSNTQPDRFVQVSSPEAAQSFEEEQDAEAAAPSPVVSKKARASTGGLGGSRRGEDGLLADVPSSSAAPAEEPVEDNDSSPSKAARSWFPETFLFAPAVVTDDAGQASVSVTVPDRLTGWRVLALAHDRAGHQAGTVAHLQSTLPVYIDPVVPAFLVAGDRVTLPVQVVNNSADDWSGAVGVQLSGATTGSFSQDLRLGAGSSRVLAVPVSTPQPGELTVSAHVGDDDATTRRLPVMPIGMPIELTRSGTLASARQIELAGPADLDPASATLRLVVSPGALSVLRRELLRADAGLTARPESGPTQDAATLLLAGRATQLLTALGAPPDDDQQDQIRALGLRAGQRVIRHGLAPTSSGAAILLPAAAAHPDNPVLSRLATRLADQLARSQRPDGTFEGGNGQTVQRMLVATAQAVTAVASLQVTAADKQRNVRVSLAASAAFERHQAQVRDPYTAAALLRSGAASPELRESLRALVRDAIVQRGDGSRVLELPEGAAGTDILRADGGEPTQAEATALAALALLDDPDAATLLPDLGASLLGAWSPTTGWGGGQADQLCLQAVIQLLKEPLPDAIEITLSRDGKEVRRGSLSGATRTQLMVLDVPGADALGLHSWTVVAQPAVPGLGFSLVLQGRVPWPDPDEAQLAERGVEALVSLSPKLQVGARGTLNLSIAAPAHSTLHVEQPLPAGLLIPAEGLDALVSAAVIESYQLSDGLLVLELPPLNSTVWSASVDVLPTLAGQLHTDATRVSLRDRPALVFSTPGPTWTVR